MSKKNKIIITIIAILFFAIIVMLLVWIGRDTNLIGKGGIPLTPLEKEGTIETGSASAPLSEGGTARFAKAPARRGGCFRESGAI
ncbi:hypothetical protein ACFL23_04490 [Patescibacteria group bacterium]